MSFQEKAEAWRTKTGSGRVRLPVLVGLTALAVVVASSAGVMLVQAITSDGITVMRAEESSEPGDDEVSQEEEEDPAICIHVGGAVVAPGVIELSSGSRVCDAIDAAGGFSEDAARDALNLARVVVDGEQLIVPAGDAASPASGVEDASQKKALDQTAQRRVNINRASVEELDTLPGVGASIAGRIVADRKENGPFPSPEDLKRVSGIGDKKYATLADRICVG